MSEMWRKIKEIISEKLYNLHNNFKGWIATKVYDDDWIWLQALIDILCQIEMYIELIRDPEFKKQLDITDIIKVEPNSPQKRSIAQQTIPENTLYCQGCPYGDTSKIATFFYGSQCNGYCYYLGKGDFSLIRSTEILWDGCKACGINEDLEDDYEIEEINAGDNL